MINKRLLIKTYSLKMMRGFMTKKRQLNCILVKEKQFLKHICAYLIQPTNNSYIVVGVEDQDNEIVEIGF
jgi:predicted HTH transcriptional regulator